MHTIWCMSVGCFVRSFNRSSSCAIVCLHFIHQIIVYILYWCENPLATIILMNWYIWIRILRFIEDMTRTLGIHSLELIKTGGYGKSIHLYLFVCVLMCVFCWGRWILHLIACVRTKCSWLPCYCCSLFHVISFVQKMWCVRFAEIS